MSLALSCTNPNPYHVLGNKHTGGCYEPGSHDERRPFLAVAGQYRDDIHDSRGNTLSLSLTLTLSLIFV